MIQIDLQPTLVGRTIRLRPLAADDFENLYQVASDPEIWEQHPDSERYRRHVFQTRFYDGALISGGAFAIEEKNGRTIIGSSRYYQWDPDKREIAIGYTFIKRELWGSGTNGELKELMLDHISRFVDAVWFHVGKENARSRYAVEKLGAKLSHEEPRELEGRQFIQLYYKLEIPRHCA